MKTCTGCQLQLETSAFGKRAQSRDGLNARCKACLRNCPKIRQYAKRYKQRNRALLNRKASEWKKRNPEKARAIAASWISRNRVRMKFLKFNINLRTKYGIDAEDWARMFNAQDGHCAICLLKLDGGFHTHVDHCHATGKVRGLLCHGCNTSLGHLLDSPTVLRSAITYLETHRASATAT